jgi:AraC family transcriptional regulator of adaptative response/methylated-DNA-[protein]-cysteine methyltransferase
MNDLEQLASDYYRIEKAIQFLAECCSKQPPLRQIAAAVHTDEYHFKRLFNRWARTAPQKFIPYLTQKYARRLVQEAFDFFEVVDTSNGFGPRRLSNLTVTLQPNISSPSSKKGRDLSISYGYHATPFGHCLLAVCRKGLCNLHFLQKNDQKHWAAWLKNYWPCASMRFEPDKTGRIVRQMFPLSSKAKSTALDVYVEGTRFQIAVWHALLNIPFGKAVTYESLACHLGIPGGARAVGNAVGKNPIPYLIPCHRVIRKNGVFGNYGGGKARKQAMLGWEAAQYDS